MRLYHQRVTPVLFVVHRVVEQSFDRHSVHAGPLDSFLTWQGEFHIEKVYRRVTRLGSSDAAESSHIARTVRTAQRHHVPVSLFLDRPRTYGVLPLGELLHPAVGEVEPKELAVHAQIRQEDDRLPVPDQRAWFTS